MIIQILLELLGAAVAVVSVGVVLLTLHSEDPNDLDSRKGPSRKFPE